MLATNSGRGFVNSDGCARTAFAAPAGQSCWAKHWSPRMSTSFAEKRKAAEKARRLAKKAKALAADDGIIAAPVASMPQVASVTLDWQPVQLISGTVPQTSPLPESSLLPGTLHEHVQMTPGGRRSHTIKHTSPAGTTRVKQYSSPDATLLQREHGSTWPSWRLDLSREYLKAHEADHEARRAEAYATAREERRQASIATGCIWRYTDHPRCGTCDACVLSAQIHHGELEPCQTVLSRLEYTDVERERLTQRSSWVQSRKFVSRTWRLHPRRSSICDCGCQGQVKWVQEDD